MQTQKSFEWVPCANTIVASISVQESSQSAGGVIFAAVGVVTVNQYSSVQMRRALPPAPA